VEAHPDAFGDRRDTNVEVEHQTYVNLEMPFGRRICRGVEMKNLLARNEHKINMATVSVLTNILRDGSIQRRGSLKAGWMDGSLSLFYRKKMLYKWRRVLLWSRRPEASGLGTG
jgi:hypothetical protein